MCNLNSFFVEDRRLCLWTTVVATIREPHTLIQWKETTLNLFGGRRAAGHIWIEILNYVKKVMALGSHSWKYYGIVKSGRVIVGPPMRVCADITPTTQI